MGDLMRSHLQKGTYAPSEPNDLRSPCPIINAFANHGLIARDGRNVRRSELDAAMRDIGLSIIVRKALISGSFIPRRDEKPAGSGIWGALRHPWEWVQWQFGIRSADQKDSNGMACLNLDQLNRHNAIEHDGSLTRCDETQGNNHTVQLDLVRQLLQASSDGEIITTDDFAGLRSRRTEQQRTDKTRLCFPWFLRYVTAGEIAATQRVFGDSSKDYAILVRQGAVRGREIAS
ncbi:MAG: hypothetical protein LQ352_004204 [Teloschistes flavicans]|nr:MAG: hypothetical protein LQ352_004204 [Teloschistes flavicans]